MLSDKKNVVDEENVCDEGGYVRAYADCDDNKGESNKNHKVHHLDLYA